MNDGDEVDVGRSEVCVELGGNVFVLRGPDGVGVVHNDVHDCRVEGVDDAGSFDIWFADYLPHQLLNRRSIGLRPMCGHPKANFA